MTPNHRPSCLYAPHRCIDIKAEVPRCTLVKDDLKIDVIRSIKRPKEAALGRLIVSFCQSDWLICALMRFDVDDRRAAPLLG